MYTVTIHAKKDPSIPWFKVVNPDLNIEGNWYLDGCIGFIDKQNIVFNDTDNINTITFDTEENWQNAYIGAMKQEFWRARAEYFTENEIEVIFNYPNPE